MRAKDGDAITVERVAELVARARQRRLPEAALQRQVMAHVDSRSARGTFVFHVGNGGKRPRIEAAILKGLGVRAGVPDLICIRAGQVCALELKAPKGKLSRDQYETIAALRAAGARVEVANTLDDAPGILRDGEFCGGERYEQAPARPGSWRRNPGNGCAATRFIGCRFRDTAP
jgi:hypothetical protein